MIAKNIITNNFNKSKTTYDDHCHIQLISGTHLIELMAPHQLQTDAVMDLGCGTGLLTEKLAKRVPFSEFHAIDFSSGLLEIAINRLRPLQIKTYLADFDYLPFYKDKFNLLFSNMSLHWSADINRAFRSFNNILANAGTFVFSIPLSKTFHEINPYCNINHFSTLNKISKKLISTEFTLLHQEASIHTFFFPDAHSALKSIMMVGANSTEHRNSYRDIKSILSRNIKELTYEIGYFIATKS